MFKKTNPVKQNFLIWLGCLFWKKICLFSRKMETHSAMVNKVLKNRQEKVIRLSFTSMALDFFFQASSLLSKDWIRTNFSYFSVYCVSGGVGVLKPTVRDFFVACQKLRKIFFSSCAQSQKKEAMPHCCVK